MLLPLGIALSVCAQVSLKYAGKSEPRSLTWAGFMIGAILAYGASFIVYSVLLRQHDLSKAGPLMAAAVALFASLAGLVLFGESLSLRRLAGLLFATAAIALLAG
jgi:multidrug transporter EmrE-like cation transporter